MHVKDGPSEKAKKTTGCVDQKGAPKATQGHLSVMVDRLEITVTHFASGKPLFF